MTETREGTAPVAKKKPLVTLAPAAEQANAMRRMLHQIEKNETLLKEMVGDTLAFDPNSDGVWRLLEPGERAALRHRTARPIPEPKEA